MTSILGKKTFSGRAFFIGKLACTSAGGWGGAAAGWWAEDTKRRENRLTVCWQPHPEALRRSDRHQLHG